MQPKHNKALIPMAKLLRRNMTKEERHLWYDFLRQHPARFSRQKVLGRYIADFYSAKAQLVIELDGSQHYEEQNAEQDAARTAFLEGYGLTAPFTQGSLFFLQNLRQNPLTPSLFVL
mgnify:CR=1 FL=1